MTIPQTFQLALERHHAGLLTDADALYRQILAAQPDHADALHLRGVIAHQTGRHDLAVQWIRQAIGVNPAALHYYLNLGNALAALGHPDEAIATYRRALALKPNYAEAHNNLGAALAGQGQADDAIAAYRRALELKPDYAEAHNNLGNTLRNHGRFDEAAAACRRALELRPDYPEAHNNLGAALAGLDRLGEAMAAYRRALELRPDYPEAHNNLGAALAGQGQFDEALAAHRRALELKPDYAEAHNNLGAALAGQARFDEALAAHRRALELKPDYPEAHNNLGNTLREQGRLDEAVSAYRRALQLKPDSSEVCNNLGIALTERNQLDEAVSAFHRALALKPDYPEAHNNLGNTLAERGQLDDAIASYRRALQVKPDYAEVYNNLGRALRKTGELDEAVAMYRRALELNPAFAEAHNNLGDALKEQGELDEAIAEFRRALEWKPEHAWVHSNLVFALHFHPGHDVRTISEEQERWNRQFSDPLKQFLRPYANDCAPERRLRVGYVSPDLRDHAVGRYVLPLFAWHDRERFEVFCYSEVPRPDWMTDRLRALAGPARNASRSDAGGGWRDTVGVSDARLAEMIREDGIDILVDLAMHTAGNRLPLFAHEPAPVQVTWLAYPGGTGLRGIGYRLTDAFMDPPGETLSWSGEPLRLPGCWCCYQPVGEYPEVNELPALSAKSVTFGSLNNFAKVNDDVLSLWARVLNAVDRSRLFMLCPKGKTRERVRAFFDARGIAAERLELVGHSPRWDYLSLYQQIDLGLDPFPYNGMTTTCDALWMGAPVLTLPGVMPASRAGLSLLSNIGLGELAANSEEDYVRIAAQLAGDLPRLANLRATLRARMQASPLMDAPRFARNVEAAFRKIWQDWRPSGG